MVACLYVVKLLTVGCVDTVAAWESVNTGRDY